MLSYVRDQQRLSNVNLFLMRSRNPTMIFRFDNRQKYDTKCAAPRQPAKISQHETRTRRARAVAVHGRRRPASYAHPAATAYVEMRTDRARTLRAILESETDRTSRRGHLTLPSHLLRFTIISRQDRRREGSKHHYLTSPRVTESSPSRTEE